MNIGILGGTFNPPHLGHLILAQEVLQKCGLDKVLFVPANIPPHKESHNVSAQDRLAMTRLLLGNLKQFEASDIEIKRGGVSYTIDTVRELKQDNPKVNYYLIAGSDLANDFSGWRYFDELREEIKIIVAKRRDYPLHRRDDGFLVAGVLQMGISSSYIRSLIKKNFSVEYLVTHKVEQYIKKHKLYR